MNSLYQIRRVVAGTALLVATLGSCQRASYVFQRADGAPHPGMATAPAVPAPAPEVGHPDLNRFSQVSLSETTRRLRVRQRASAVPVAKHRPVTAKAVARARPWPTAAAPPARPAEPGAPVRHRSRGLALLLALLPVFGIFGVHRFYLGYYGAGAAFLLAGLVGEALLLIYLYSFLLGVTTATFGATATVGTGFLVAGAIILAGLETWAIVDAVRIATGHLLPKKGEYNPRWFQLRARANGSTAETSPK